MANRIWTQQEEDILRQERQQGSGVAQIAAALSRSEASVSGKIRDMKEKGGLAWTDRQGREINTAKSQKSQLALLPSSSFSGTNSTRSCRFIEKKMPLGSNSALTMILGLSWSKVGARVSSA